MTRKVLRDLLGLDVAAQRRVSAECRQQRKGRNGRKGFRKLDREVCEKYLTEHSRATSQLYVGRGKRKAGEEVQVKVKRALTDSARQLRLQSDFKHACSQATWYRMLKSKMPEFSKCCRKLDVCGKCHDWDESLSRRLHTSLTEWRQTLKTLLPVYWDPWDAKVDSLFSEHEQAELSDRFLIALRNYVDQGPTRRPDGCSLKQLLELHEAEAAIRHELDTKWARSTEQIGVIELVQMFSVHFLLRDRQNEAFLKDWHTPCPDTVHELLDFKQHDTLPVGPSEKGSWWYANARLQVKVLTVIVWTATSGHLYNTYASHVLDQSTPFALTCVEDALERSARDGATPGRRQVIWADCGGHFRSCRFLCETLITSLQQRLELETAEVHFFAEGHGKRALRRTFRPHVQMVGVVCS